MDAEYSVGVYTVNDCVIQGFTTLKALKTTAG